MYRSFCLGTVAAVYPTAYSVALSQVVLSGQRWLCMCMCCVCMRVWVCVFSRLVDIRLSVCLGCMKKPGDRYTGSINGVFSDQRLSKYQGCGFEALEFGMLSYPSCRIPYKEVIVLKTLYVYVCACLHAPARVVRLRMFVFCL